MNEPVRKVLTRKNRHSKREPLANQAGNKIRAMIIKGEMPPGSRIPERQLCEALSISRTPLREALKLLEREGLVEISQNRGAKVMSFTREEARDLFEVLAGIESLAAQLAAKRITPEELDQLEVVHADMVRHFKNGDLDPYFELNSKIHDLVVEYSGNGILKATRETLMLRARRGRYMAIVKPARWQESVDEHEGLMVALRAGDVQAAQQIWHQHLNHTGETVCAVLESLPNG